MHSPSLVVVGERADTVRTCDLDKLIIGVVFVGSGMMVGVRHRLHIAHPIIAIGGCVVEGVGNGSGLVVIVVQELASITVRVSHLGGLASIGVSVGGGV